MAKKKTEEKEIIEEKKDAPEPAELQEEEALIEKPKEGLAVELGEVKELEEQIVEEVKKKGAFEKEVWKPKTSLGINEKNGVIKNISYVLDQRIKILEPEIVDTL